MATLTLGDLLELLGHDDHTAICTQEDGGPFSTAVLTSSDARGWTVPTDRDVWFGVNPTTGPARSNAGRGTAADVTRLCALYADLDIKDGGLATFDEARTLIDDLSEALTSRPVAITYSGHGMQPYWLIDEHVTGSAATALLRRFGRLVRHFASIRGGDVDSVFDLARVLRAPGSNNHKAKPVLVTTLAEQGHALSIDEINDALLGYGVVEQPEDAAAIGSVVTPPEDWTHAGRTCTYTQKMIQGWSGENPKARHPWLVSQATRLAAAHRLGCITEDDHRDAVEALRARFTALLSTGEKRREQPAEVLDALTWGQTTIASKTDEAARRELGGHDHDKPRLSIVQTNTGVTFTTDGTSALKIDQQGSDIPRSYTATRTDHGNAQLLVATHGHRLRYAPSRGAWLAWDGARWAWCDDDSTVIRAAVEVIHAIDASDDAAAKHKTRSLSRGSLESMVALARRDAAITVPVDALDADPWILNTPTGVVDLRTGTLTASDPNAADVRTKITGTAYGPDATAPRWQQFLHDTFGGDEQIVTFVQRLAGYSASGIVTHHVLPFLHGGGGNGKSVFLNVLQRVLGDYASTAPASFLMAGKNDESAVARLSGLRMVICSEVNPRARFDEEKVKLLTGGDAITARFLYQNHFTFQPTHKLWLMGNHQPRVESGGESFWRRLRLVPFTHTVPKEERVDGLDAQLVESEGPGILAWIVQGSIDALRGGLREPSAVLEATASYAEEEDALARFVGERIRVGGGELVKEQTSSVRAAYAEWCRREGERELTQQSFGRELKARFGIEVGRSNGKKFYLGMMLLADPESEPEEHWSDR